MPNIGPRTHKRSGGGDAACGRGGRQSRLTDDPAKVTCIYCAQGVRGISGHRGDVLGESRRFRVEHARDCLATWDLSRGPDSPYMDRETVLADQVRALLAVIDQVAPKGDQ